MIDVVRILRSPKGYSLVEVFIVIGIVGVLCAIAIPQLNSVMQSNRVNTANALLVSKLSEAKIQSIKRNSSVSLKLNLQTRKLWLESGGSQISEPENLPGDVTIDFSPATASSEKVVTFNSFGNLVNMPVTINTINSKANLGKNIQISLSGKIEVGQMAKVR